MFINICAHILSLLHMWYSIGNNNSIKNSTVIFHQSPNIIFENTLRVSSYTWISFYGCVICFAMCCAPHILIISYNGKMFNYKVDNIEKISFTILSTEKLIKNLFLFTHKNSEVKLGLFIVRPEWMTRRNVVMSAFTTRFLDSAAIVWWSFSSELRTRR